MVLDFPAERSRRRIDVAASKVAQAVGRTPDAVKKWREEWEKRDGKESVKRMLAEQKEIGASGEPPPETLSDLPEIARRWQAAVDPRRAKKDNFGPPKLDELRDAELRRTSRVNFSFEMVLGRYICSAHRNRAPRRAKAG